MSVSNLIQFDRAVMIYSKDREPFWLKEPLKSHMSECISFRATQHLLTVMHVIPLSVIHVLYDLM